jgi:glycosyltransferase involved in cell wall biosynthesis
VISAYKMTAGLERVAVEYARGLRTLGHEVVVYAQTVERTADDDGIRFSRVGGMKRWIAARAATFPLAATRALDGSRLDNILAFGSVLLRPAVVRLPGAHRSWWDFANAAWPVTTVDGLRRRLNPHHRLILAWDHRVLGRGLPKAVLAAGRWAADDIARFYPPVARKVRLLPDGVNLGEFSYDHEGGARLRKLWGEGPVLFTVATELRRKGLDSLFAAIRLVREQVPDATLVVGGHVPPGDVRALAVHHRINNAVKVIGFVDDLRAAYSAADLLVFPTLFDPWGLPITEALACGLPVVASARAGASGVIAEGVTGTTISDPRDPAAVADSILRGLAITPDRDALRASVEHLAWPKVVADLEGVLEETKG